VAIAGLNINYGTLAIVTYEPPASSVEILCDLPSSLPPGLFCIGQSWLGSSGQDLYLVDCYYTRIMRFDFGCNLISQVQLQTSGNLSLVNAPMASFNPLQQ